MNQIMREDDLDDENYQVREVFAQFGLAMYQAQTLEKGLVNVFSLARGNDNPVATRSDFDAILDEAGRKTMGRLLRLLSPYLAEDSDLITDLNEGLEVRNRLAHWFFWDHAADFMRTDGREVMLAELHLATKQMENLDRRLEPVLDRFLAARGIHSEEKERLVAEAMTELMEPSRTSTGP